MREISYPFLFVIRAKENKTPGKNYDINANKICMSLTKKKKKKELQKFFSP